MTSECTATFDTLCVVKIMNHYLVTMETLVRYTCLATEVRHLCVLDLRDVCVETNVGLSNPLDS